MTDVENCVGKSVILTVGMRAITSRVTFVQSRTFLARDITVSVDFSIFVGVLK